MSLLTDPTDKRLNRRSLGRSRGAPARIGVVRINRILKRRYKLATVPIET
jgi:hypothetical protein